MRHWNGWKRITVFVWLFFAGVLLRVIWLGAWKMDTMESRYAMIAAGASLVCAIFLAIASRISKEISDARQMRQEEAEKAAQKVAAKKEKKEIKEHLNTSGFRVSPVVSWLFILGFVGLLFGVVFPWLSSPAAPPPVIYFSEFLSAVEEGKIEDVFITPRDGGTREIIGAYTADHSKFRTVDPGGYPDLVPFLRKHNVKILSEHAEKQSVLWSLFFAAWPMLLLIGVWIYFMRKMSPGGGTQFSQKKNLEIKKPEITFADVAGVDEAKEELQEIVAFLKNPEKFSATGARIPKGILLTGPPGCGKTLLARAVAGEADASFITISGSEFVEVFVGVGASRVRNLFENAKRNSPCIAFIDEIDAVGRHRGAGLGNSNDEREQTLNQLLVAMDGFEENSGIIVIAATNRPDILDPALLRPGRFDRHVVVERPDLRGREEILRIYTRKISLDASVNLHVIARGTSGFTGADLENLCNEAALLQARRGRDAAGAAEFEDAKDKVLMGTERKSVFISEKEKKITAYHEAGHTIVARSFLQHDFENTDPLHKVSIIPRGRAMGVTQQLPQEDVHMHSKQFLLNILAILMGGRVAEELMFGEGNITTGASNDIERATDIAKQMVCEFGMSSELAKEFGPRTFGHGEAPVFLGKEVGRQKNYGDEIARKIDQAIGDLTRDAYKKAHTILTHDRAAFVACAESLIARETLDGGDIDAIWRENHSDSSAA
jgi:cell division protease FtsH